MPLLAAACVAVGLFVASCSDPASTPVPERLAIGTWGGDDAAVIVTEEQTHVHIGCTFGDMPAVVPLDDEGRFSIKGNYVLQAYPVVVGPTLPATFEGQVDGDELRLSVAVDDTVSNKVVTLGPVLVVFGQEPDMGPCPICQLPEPDKP